MRTILRRIALALIGASVLATAAGVLVIALALALYSFLLPWLGAPGAAAGVALAAALLTGMVGLSLVQGLLSPPPRPKASDPPDPLQTLIALIKSRPIASGSALVAALLLALRNPALMATLVKALLDPGGKPGRKG